MKFKLLHRQQLTMLLINMAWKMENLLLIVMLG